MTKLNSYDELLAEQQRLRLKLQVEKAELKFEMAVIREKLRPVTTVVELAEKLITHDKNNPLVDTGISLGVDLLLRKIILRNAGWVVRLLGPLFVRNYLSHEIKDGTEWVRRISRFFREKFSRQPEA